MIKLNGLLMAVAGLAVLGAACQSSGAGGRKVEITQTDQGCTPTSIAVTAGEKLDLTIKNASSSDAYELEGIDGTKLEETVVHEGKTLSVGYSVPSSGETRKMKCYVAAGVTTIIELVPGTGAAAADRTSEPGTATPSLAADTTVKVQLSEYTVTPDGTAVKAGKIKFEASNVSKSQVHELAVLKKKADGTFDNAGEVEGIQPGAGGEVVLDLAAGEYQLACLIAVGEAGSTVDHYAQGMHTDFTVTE